MGYRRLWRPKMLQNKKLHVFLATRKLLIFSETFDKRLEKNR